MTKYILVLSLLERRLSSKRRNRGKRENLRGKRPDLNSAKTSNQFFWERRGKTGKWLSSIHVEPNPTYSREGDIDYITDSACAKSLGYLKSPASLDLTLCVEISLHDIYHKPFFHLYVPNSAKNIWYSQSGTCLFVTSIIKMHLFRSTLHQGTILFFWETMCCKNPPNSEWVTCSVPRITLITW